MFNSSNFRNMHVSFHVFNSRTVVKRWEGGGGSGGEHWANNQIESSSIVPDEPLECTWILLLLFLRWSCWSWCILYSIFLLDPRNTRVSCKRSHGIFSVPLRCDSRPVMLAICCDMKETPPRTFGTNQPILRQRGGLGDGYIPMLPRLTQKRERFFTQWLCPDVWLWRHPATKYTWPSSSSPLTPLHRFGLAPRGSHTAHCPASRPAAHGPTRAKGVVECTVHNTAKFYCCRQAGKTKVLLAGREKYYASMRADCLICQHINFYSNVFDIFTTAVEWLSRIDLEALSTCIYFSIAGIVTSSLFSLIKTFSAVDDGSLDRWAK